MSLATNGIENGPSRSYLISLAGHILLIGAIFLFPSQRKKIFVESMPRPVRLVATLEAPAPSPPKAKPKPVPKPPPPKPKARPRVVQPTPAPPPPRAESKIKVPVKKAPPLVKPRDTAPAPTSLKERLASKLSALDKTPARPPEQTVPELAAPAIEPLSVPSVSAPMRPAPSRDLASLSGFRHTGYVNEVKATIYRRWSVPSSFTLGGRRLAAEATIRIARDGKIIKVELTRPSGHRLYDQSVLAAVTGDVTLPRLPADYKEDYLDVGITFKPEKR